MAKTLNVNVSSDSTIKVNGALFTKESAVAHCAALYDTLWLNQATQLDLYREIGLHLLGLKSLFGDNDKAFGKFIAESELGAMSRQDRADAMFLASNWNAVQKLNNSGALDTLGVSAIRKRLKTAEGKGAGVRKADQKSAEGKAEAEPLAEDMEIAESHVQTEEELAAFVVATLAANGLDTKAFLKALQVAIKGA